MTYPIEIAGLHRELPLCQIGEDLSIAAFIMLGDAEITVACAEALLKLVPQSEYDYLFSAEAKSIPLIHEMARQTGAEKFFIARKDLIRGKRILLVDDVISRGGSLRAMENLVEQAGGTVVGRLAVLAEGDAAERFDIQVLGTIPLFHADGTPIA